VSEPIALVPRKQQTQDSVIEALEAALAEAREGVVFDVAIVSITAEGATSYSNKTHNRLALIGAVACLLHALQDAPAK
jgi:hypothetical protein